ncbi:unnamed protein product [Vitrella brassicaformis CCMP3155]|uniref:Uncharacterized protein n=2 Tax=Vitrella brassicaformis TaxID=1169539 RepID=A0A0G4F7N1_VITBC|nr:unnamed protein product [Vitrella brassicaformis CCMP3155]|eukprot:CEM08118.1 unnamed protein product [Vitrella brassicaformis CCMP3155]
MVQAATRELTILGFIALLLFSAVRWGIVKAINDSLFGIDRIEATAVRELTSHHEPKELAITKMFELFESVHYFVFAVMVTFILMTTLLIILALRQTNVWHRYDKLTMADLSRRGVSSAAISYWGTKHRFHTNDNMFIAKPTQPCRFSFASYLSVSLLAFLTSLVEIPVMSWMVLLAVAVLAKPALSLGETDLAVFLSVCLAGLFLVSLTFCVHIGNKRSYVEPNVVSVSQEIHQGTPDRVHAAVEKDAVVIPSGQNAISRAINATFGLPSLVHRDEMAFAPPPERSDGVIELNGLPVACST